MTEQEDEKRAAARVAPAAEGPARCSGALAELAVADVVQLLQLIGKSAVMTVTVAHQGARSRLWCAEGSLIDAESGRLRGEAAAYRILSLDDGWLEAELRQEERPRTIYAPTQRLLLEAARRTDELQALKRKLGGARCCYRLVHEPEPEQLTSPTAAELRLLQLLSATASVAELLAESELGDLETLIALERWFEAGRLAQVGLRPDSSPSVPPLAASVPPVSGSATPPGVARRRRSAALAASAALLAAASFAGGYLLRDGAAGPVTSTASSGPHADEPLDTPARVASALAPAARKGATPAGAVLAAANRSDEAAAAPSAALASAAPELAHAPHELEVASPGATAQQASPAVSAAAPAARASNAGRPAAPPQHGRTRAAAAPSISEPRVRVIGVTEPSIRVLD